METQTATKAETKIPQPMVPKNMIPEAVMTLTDTPQPRPKNPFSKKQKFKAVDFFHEHVFFIDYNSYDTAHLRRKCSLQEDRPLVIPSCVTTGPKVC